VNLLNPSEDEPAHSQQKLENPFGALASPRQADGINADEFEHIAEIYDQIRLLH
jgi:protein-arginine kinase activator protein McsA